MLQAVAGTIRVLLANLLRTIDAYYRFNPIPLFFSCIIFEVLIRVSLQQQALTRGYIDSTG
jgi:hypothetical protein